MSTFLIIGGGIAGPVAALRLVQDGNKCIIFERSAKPQTIGGAVNVAPNGMRLLSRLGVLDAMRSQSCTVHQIEVRTEQGGTIGYLDHTAKDGFVGCRIMRSALQDVLLAEARKQGIEIHFSKYLESIERDETTGKMRITFKDGSSADGDFVIGADGIHSTVRKYVLAGQESQELEPQYHGQTLAYGIVHQKDAPGVDFKAQPATTGIFSQKGFFAHAFTDDTRSSIYWVAAVRKEKADKILEGDKIRDEILERFRGLYQPIPKLITHATEFFSWPVYQLPEMATWSRDNVVLVGDAAHALPPNVGQGVSQAIEDVFVLARVLKVGAELSRYEAIRMPRIDKLRRRIKSQDREVEKGPWVLWIQGWLMWVALSVMSVLSSWLDLSGFEYDPDKEEI